MLFPSITDRFIEIIILFSTVHGFIIYAVCSQILDYITKFKTRKTEFDDFPRKIIEANLMPGKFFS